MIRLDEEVYSFIKARAVEEKKSLSDVIKAMYSTSGGNQTLEHALIP